MSSIILLAPEESVEQQSTIRRRSLYPIKHLLAHLDIDDDLEADNLTSLTQNFFSITKHLSNAEICELSDEALDGYVAEFLETRSTFGESGNATMGDKFWPTGRYEKKLTYAKHPTMIRTNIKLIMANQRDNKRATFAKNLKRRRNEAAADRRSGSEGSTSAGHSSDQESGRVNLGGRLPGSLSPNIPTISCESSPPSATWAERWAERSVTLDGLPSPVPSHSSPPDIKVENLDRQNTPKRRKHEPNETMAAESAAPDTKGVASDRLAPSNSQSGPFDGELLNEQGMISTCHSRGWDAGVWAIQTQIERHQAEIQKASAEAEAAGNARKKMNCDHISDALQELLARVCAERKKKEDKMKAAPHAWFSALSTRRRASFA